MKTDIKEKVHGGDAEQTHKSKLDQIKSGTKKVRSTGGAEKKAVVTTGKDGAKFIINENVEKFEETGVTRKKRNYVMYEAKLGTEKTTDITKIAGPKLFKPKPKPVREIEPRVEEKIIMKKKKKEYLDNYQYHETKDIKNPDPRLQVVVEHQRLGDIIGGTFEETTMERKVFSQGSNRPQLTEKTTTTKTTGTANPVNLRGNKSAVTLKKTTVTTGAAPKQTGNAITVNKKTTTTTTNTRTRANPTNATAKNEKVTETTTRRRNEGTGSKTETKTETKTTTSGTRGGPTGTSTTTKTTTRTTTQKPAETAEKTSTTTTTKTTTTKTTKTTTTKTTGGDGEAATKTETKTTTSKTEEKSGNEGGDADGASSIRKKYAKGRFAKP